jgi:glycosyltransferase involved in cell wall biosynthesis
VVDVQYGGVNIERFSPRPKDNGLVKRHGLEGKVVVLFVGNLQPFKGLDILMDAMSRIKDQSVVLLVVGGGYAEKSYKILVKKLGIENQVIFAGPTSPDEDLPYYYNLADFLVLPSTHSESFGLVVIEAMASGKPAIVSSLPGPSQLIEDGTDGLIVRVGDVEDLKNKVEFLAREKEERNVMGSEARKKIVEQYTWDTIGWQLENSFKTMMAAN